MEKIKRGFNWALKNFLLISTIIFLALYARWFLLIPSIQLLVIVTSWVLANLILIIIIRRSKNRTLLKTAALIVWIFLFAITSLESFSVFLFSNPKVIDSGIYNRTVYLLVAYHNDATTYSPDHHNLTKWYGLFRFETQYVDFTSGHARLFYDKKLGIVNIVAHDEETGKEWLIFADTDLPRHYTLRGISSENYRFYPSVECIEYTSNTCMTHKHMIYQCELDNTGCTPLPFQFTGKDDYAYIELNEATQEYEFYIWPNIGDEFLVYSYGDHPRCYVEGCEILSQP
jgi:hypothetical protein